MILPHLVLALSLGSQEVPQAQGQPLLSPAKLISKMFSKYMAAHSMAGTIQLTLTTSGKEAVSATTDFQFKPTSFLYIKQTEGDNTAFAVCDGKTFAYPVPVPEKLGPKYLFEDVTQKGSPLDYRDIFGIASPNLLDRSAPLEFAFGRQNDLRYRAKQFVKLVDGGEVQINGKVVRKITGPWREKEPPPGTVFKSTYLGTFEIYITEDGNLIRYVYSANFSLPVNNGPNAIVHIQWVYDTDFRVDTEVDSSKFQLPKN